VALISVIIPCYNREDLLCATLDSLRAQTCLDWEVIIMDDHSKDKSFEVARRYSTQDARFRAFLRQGDLRGANVCRNQGLLLAKGNYIVFLDSDDLLSQTCLERRVAAMDNAPDCGFGVYQTELFAEHIGDRGLLWNIHTDSNDLHRFLSLDSVWHTTGPIWRKEAVTQLGGFDEELPSFQDWAISVRALIAGIKYFKAPVRDHFYRHEYGNDTAISAVSCIRGEHLRSHEQLFSKVLGLLAAGALLNDDVHHRVTGLFWWLANRWVKIGNISEADRVWSKARDLSLCNRREYLGGLVIFRLLSIRGGGRLARLIQFTWPSQYYRSYSKHFQNAPVNSEKPVQRPTDAKSAGTERNYQAS
jgi:glycosyltransferase involved in cell wall biosynthesis